MKLSIVIPAYNMTSRLRIFENLLKSKEEFEIICVDDGSTDGTPKAIKKLKDPRIKIFEREHEGLLKTWHYGVSKAQGDYVVVMDADDYVDEDYIEVILNFIDNQKADMLMVLYYTEKENGENTVWKLPFSDGLYCGEKLEEMKKYLTSGRSCNTKATKIVKREFYLEQIRNLRTCDINDFEDWITMMEIYGLVQSIYLLNKPFYHYVQYPSSVSKSKVSYRSNYGDALKMVSYLKNNGGNGFDEKVTDSIRFYALRSILMRSIKIKELDLVKEIVCRKDFQGFLWNAKISVFEKIVFRTRSARIFYVCYWMKTFLKR